MFFRISHSFGEADHRRLEGSDELGFLRKESER